MIFKAALFVEGDTEYHFIINLIKTYFCGPDNYYNGKKVEIIPHTNKRKTTKFDVKIENECDLAFCIYKRWFVMREFWQY